MNRKTAFIVIVTVLSLLIGGLIGFYFYAKRVNPNATFLGIDISGRNFANYDPTTGNQNAGTSTPQEPGIIGTDAGPREIPKLRKISDNPVAGFSFTYKDIYSTSTVRANVEPPDLSRGGRVAPAPVPRLIGTQEFIRFMERATGHIYETSTTTVVSTRISNTTLPKIYEALFAGKGDSLIIRDLIGSTDIIRTQYASIVKASSTDGEMETTLKDLPVNLMQTVLSPLKNQIFSIQKDGVTGYLSTLDGGGVQNILDMPFKEWLVQWPERRTILLTTKPTGFFPGYAYVLNPETRAFSRVLGGINGLTTNMSPDASKILYSKSGAGTFDLFSFDRRTSQSIDLQVKTLPEKCVWANTEADTIYCAVPEDIAFNTYPDVWYQGRITFSDSIWKINVSTLEARLISRLQTDALEVIDVQSMRINPADDYLLFDNKVTLDLWGYRLKEYPKPFDPLSAIGTSTASTSQQR